MLENAASEFTRAGDDTQLHQGQEKELQAVVSKNHALTKRSLPQNSTKNALTRLDLRRQDNGPYNIQLLQHMCWS